MKQFNLKKEDYYAEGWKLYNTTIFTIDPGVTVLVGCNGSGKSTLLRFIDRQLEDEKIPHLFFNNLCDGGNHSMNKALFYGNMDFVMQNAMASEGERIFNNICQIASRCGRSIRASKQEGANEFFLLLDAIDSGFSVDNIVDIKKNLFNVLIEDAHNNGITPYIIVSANEYELARNEKCLDVYTGKYVEFSSYDEYREFIIKSREIKNKRYKKCKKK